MRSPTWNEVTAVFGGRFDPPHLGHREAVRGLFQHPGIRQVLILPSATPPHKPATAKPKDRAEMAKICFSSTSSDSYPQEVKIDFRELERAQRNPSRPSYSYDTLCELKPLYSQLAFVIGADQLSQFSTWHRFSELFTLCHWIVLERQPSGEELARKTLTEWEASQLARPVSSNLWLLKGSNHYLKLVPTEAMPISSTAIREAITRTGSPPDSSLLPEVWAYLKQQKLYGIYKSS